jgi:hypothetical protein
VELSFLQKSGVIRIGNRSDRNTLFVLRCKVDPDRLAVGFNDRGLRVLSGHPFLVGMEALDENTDIVMVCHHSSAREISAKIRAALKSKAAEAPGGMGDIEGMAWFRSSFDDVIYAYPPFAKIFLSHVPLEDKEGADPEEGDSSNSEIKTKEEMERDFERARRRARGLEDFDDTPSKVHLLSARGAGNIISIIFILAVAAMTALTGLNRDDDPSTGFGTEIVEMATSLVSSGALPGEPENAFPSPFKPDFRTWYERGARSGDTGLTFGLSNEVRGFRLRTWSHPVRGGEALYAAYEYEDALPNVSMFASGGVIDEGRLKGLMRISETSLMLFKDGCQTVFGDLRSRYGTQEVLSLQVLISADRIVLDDFMVYPDACLAGMPIRESQDD